ncbi:MAG: hypothetical protein ACK5QG_01745 [Bacteroidota bacterium]|jgi:hypothetical protein|nr:hypothetical protein [Cytophagales bacterium]MCE2956860.1 hypothetical protein [Flammeovirgaceae bacterium]
MKPLLLIMGLLISENALSQSILSQVANLKSKVKKNEYFTEREFMDSTGNVLFTISFDKDDAIENNPMGFAIIANKFDAKGNVVERKFLDKNERLFRTEGTGPAIERFSYDNRSNLVETSYYDEKNNLISGRFALILAKHDSKGNTIEEQFFNAHRQLADGISILKYKYDLNNNRIEEKRFYKNGQPVSYERENLASTISYKYDDKARIVEKSFYKDNGELVDGDAIVRYNYDIIPPNDIPSIYNNNNTEWAEEVRLDKNRIQIKRYFVPRAKTQKLRK